MLTDGVPEPESTFYPLYNVRQVEVLKGPTAILYGGNPLAGAVHLVRKQPQPRRFADASFVVRHASGRSRACWTRTRPARTASWRSA